MSPQAGADTMKMILIAVGALVVGIALGIVFSAATIRHLRSRIKELRAGYESGGSWSPAALSVLLLPNSFPSLCSKMFSSTFKNPTPRMV